MAVTAVRRIGAGVVAVTLVAAALFITLSLRRRNPPSPSCRVSTGAETYTLDIDQAANSTTIAAVGKRLGLPNHAVTIALVAALQESRLRNLTYGDRPATNVARSPSQRVPRALPRRHRP